MEVNFNNLRKQACNAYDRLCNKLNAAKCSKDAIGTFVDDFGHLREDSIVINASDIQKDMDSLRSMIGAVAMVYENDRDDFKDVYTELYPQTSEIRMAEFNPDPE